MTLRMIFPERVLGMSATIHTCFGRAILPIWVSIALATFSSMSLLGVNPGLSATYISTTRPRSSSITRDRRGLGDLLDGDGWPIRVPWFRAGGRPR